MRSDPLNTMVVYEDNWDIKLTSTHPRQKLNLGSEPRLLSLSRRKGSGGDSDNGDFDKSSCAVVVRNAAKSYGSCKVIDGLNMTIQEGTIYCFLGSSGCGKSTVLSCIVGLNKFTSGKVWVFGKEPGTRNSDVPGKSVGYMPQDYALHNQLTVTETLIYHGTMNGMSKTEIKYALTFYTDLLELPEHSSRVVELSGGQKRRVSLVVALMHNPPLLILDEPTAGVDPLLCESIWKHLTHLTRSKRTTVLITTQNTESARHSDTIGLMRHGKLIVEKSPKELFVEYQETSLEAVVLQLCKADSQLKTKNTNWEIGLNVNRLHQLSLTLASQSYNRFELNGKSCLRSLAESGARTRALIQKNTSFWQLSIGMLLMSIFFPAGGFLLTHFCFDDPKYLRLGVVNEETNGTAVLCGELQGGCDVSWWSCKYLDQLEYPEFILDDYDTVADAEEGVRLGQIRGFLYFPRNFSNKLFLRSENLNGAKSSLDSFNGSNILVHLDKSNSVISETVEFGLYKAFGNFLRQILDDCNLDPRQGEYSLNYMEPPMGKDLTKSHFTTPSFFIGSMFFFPIITTGVQFVSEKRAGTINRSIVAGVQSWEIFLSYFIAETSISCLRMVFMYASATLLIGMNISGSLLLEGGLGLLVGWVGIAFGFLFSSICSEEVQVALLGLAIYLPNFVLSGMMWPLEGMPDILQKIAYVLPCTLPSEGMRSMVNRGWGIENANVWPGFVSAGAYILVIFFGVVVVSMRNKSK